ncbi:MAG: hypothetical protein ACOCX9_09440, partial [Spirochaetota bacterium]
MKEYLALAGVRKLAETSYGEINPMVQELIRRADEAMVLKDVDGYTDVLADLMHAADMAFADLEARRVEYLNRMQLIRNMEEKAIDLFRKYYPREYTGLLDRRLDQLKQRLDQQKLEKSVDEEYESMGDFLKKKTMQAARHVKKASGNFVDNVKILFSLIPFFNVKSRYSELMEEYFGEESVKQIHEDTMEKIIPLIQEECEKSLREELDRGVLAVDGGNTYGAGFNVDDVGAALKVSVISIVFSVSSTVVLAAGWHTVSWSVLNLLLPSILWMVLPLAFFAMIFFNDRDVEKRKSTIDDARQKIHTYVKEQLTLQLSDTLRENLKAERDRVSSEQMLKIFHVEGDGINGIFVDRCRGELDRLIHGMGEAISSTHNDEVDWKKLSGESLALVKKNDDMEYAVLYLSAVFESLMGACNGGFRLGVKSLKEGSAGILVKMRDENIISEDKYALLTAARRVRNRCAHRFHRFKMLPGKQQREQ